MGLDSRGSLFGVSRLKARAWVWAWVRVWIRAWIRESSALGVNCGLGWPGSRFGLAICATGNFLILNETPDLCLKFVSKNLQASART